MLDQIEEARLATMTSAVIRTPATAFPSNDGASHIAVRTIKVQGSDDCVKENAISVTEEAM